MSVCIDDFERQAALRIDGSCKSPSELVVELRTMLESCLYLGEEVRFGSVLNFHIGRVIDCINLQAAEGIERKYTVLCNGKLHKNIDSAQLKRTREVSDEELRKLIRWAAVQSFATGAWSLRENHWNFYDYAVNRNAYIKWKQKRGIVLEKQRREAIKGIAAICLVLMFPISFVGFILYGAITYVPPERQNGHFADEALEAMREMNKTTSDHFWKQLVIDEKISLSDPSALEGIAHLFVFESSRANRTTLREYVDRTPAEPPAIFFAFGESKEELEDLPAVRSLVEVGHEVLLVTDALDRKALQSITWFEGKTLMNARWYEQSKRAEGSTAD